MTQTVPASQCDEACAELCANNERIGDCGSDKYLKVECKECSKNCPKGSVPRYLIECSKTARACAEFKSCADKYDPESEQ